MNQRILTLLGLLLLPLAAPAQTELPVRIGPFLQQVAEYAPPNETDASPAAPAPSPTSTADAPGEFRGVATDAATLSIAAASSDGLYLRSGAETAWRRLFPHEGDRSWAPVDVRAVTFDYDGRLWFASPQGMGALDLFTGTWRLYDRTDGLPWNDFTSLAAAPDGSIWAGTTRGLVHLMPGLNEETAASPDAGETPAFPGAESNGGPRAARRAKPRWQYRQGRRWLPHDHVLAVEVEPDGAVRVETAAGPGAIHLRPTTLRQKADHFDRQIDRFHRRTPYGYVGGVALERAGETSAFTQHDSDNDGLWTAMYGAAECLRWAVTGDPEARKRARQAFEALRFLQLVTQGGTPPALPGFVARSILPADGPDPNAGQAERDRQLREERDGLWKIIDPRWPTNADGKWYWKSDTSSDELDGHFFFYGLYYDLVARGDAERAEVRETVLAIVDHLVDHGGALVDHDGKPTRWAVFGPEQLNDDREWWEERGLNSLSYLTYLRIAEHMSYSGSADDARRGQRYAEAARTLLDDHAYAANLRNPKVQSGPGTGNQSDDEMAFMNYYHLLKYERDEALRSVVAHSLRQYWKLLQPERNPLFDFIHAAAIDGASYRDAFDDETYSRGDFPLHDAVESLVLYPLDRFDWALTNSHRQDIVLLRAQEERRGPRGHLIDGRVLPIDERYVNHWNHDPWLLDHGGQGRYLADGASFLLPYYLGLYHGLIEETAGEAGTEAAE